MKIAAVICEYNPFHNGHKYQIEMIKRDYDAVIAIMSGSFVQRGELAMFDKWTRAKTALLNGVDLVIELPVCYALNTAECFACGSVMTAESTGVVDALCFGSESGNISEFLSAATVLNNEPEEVSLKIRQQMMQGMSYPSAREHAYSGVIPSELLSKPNNILGLEYVKALKKINSKIKPMTIKRIGAGYNETDSLSEFNSASGIRKMILNGEDISNFVPENTAKVIEKAVKYDTEKLFYYIKYTVISADKKKLAGINDMREGLENRIVAAVKSAKSYGEMLDIIKTRRYTMSHIKRVLIAILLKMDSSTKSPEYLRVLGMTDLGKNILKEMKEKAKLPIVVKTADFQSQMLDMDILATDIAALTANADIGRDYKISPVISENSN